MRRIWVAVLVVPLAGCGLELLGTTAIRSGMEAQQAKQLTDTLRRVEGSTSRMGVEQAVQAYRAEKGVNPPSLEAMVQEGFLPSIPVQPNGEPYGYDPATGRIIEGVAAMPMTQAPAMQPGGNPEEALKQVRGAVFRYWSDKKAYPPNLQALVPQYLPSLPKAAGGQDFLYNPQSGQVAAPMQAMPYGQPGMQQVPQAMPQRRGGGLGTTPMVESMTGLGVQQELNRGMGQSGTSAAGAYGRRQAESIPDARTNQQMQVMDNLGL